MSYVSRVKGVDKYKYSDILKLLDKPEGWFLQDEGTTVESFKHKETGWYFYTGINIVNFRKEYNIECRATVLQFLVNLLSFKEYRFTRKWIKEN